MDSFTDHDLEQCYAKIVETFKGLGYPQDLIGQWTLPQRDAQTLMGIIRECRPQNILEVGTFVGVTTLLMALLSSPETHIHSIDPNFPLKVEMESMKSKLYDFDTSIKAQELARQAAQKLGVDRKITFHEGGFSTGNTFASYNTSPSSRISVIGPEVCRGHGPFDFIFIDGLHYEEDVFSDVCLAAEHAKPTGLIAIHDVLGRWGSNVRRGVFRFLEKNDDFQFSHSNFYKVFDSIGLLQRHPKGTGPGHALIDQDIKNRSIFQEKLLSNLAAILVNIFSPASVIQLGGDIALLKQLKHLGIEEVCAFLPFSQETNESSVPVKVFNQNDRIPLDKKYDLCLCFEIFDVLPGESVDKIIQTCVDLSDTVIFAASPPGEMGNFQQNNKPITYWIRKFFEKGYLFSDTIRPILEPHGDALYAESQHNSSYLLNLYLVKKDYNLTSDKIEKSILEEVIIDKERRIEDLQLQNLYQRCIIEHERKMYIPFYQKYQDIFNENRALVEELASINIFNQRVINNSIKRAKEIFYNIIHFL